MNADSMSFAKHLLVLLPFLWCTSLFAQEYLGDDRAYFQSKTEHLQRWLVAKGLANYLTVDTVRLAKQGYELELWLSLRTTDEDLAAALWPALEAKYRAEAPSRDFNALLFDTFVRFMEVPPAQANVQVYLPKSLERDVGYSPCFKVWIWRKDGALQLDRELNGCKAQNITIPINLRGVDTQTGAARAVVYQPAEARDIFQRVLAFAERKYAPENRPAACNERDPRVEEIELSDYELKFVVSDLCREVLTQEDRSLWCELVERWWGPCNDMRRERLEFVVDYLPTTTGYLLKIEVTGKYGSGVYVPRRSGYMDMDPDFEEDFLVPYVKQFKNELTAYLSDQ
jgi:hypothetical protein